MSAFISLLARSRPSIVGLAAASLFGSFSAMAAAPDVSDAVRTGHDGSGDYAIIIGVEDYASLAPVDYARADALAFESLAVHTLGIPNGATGGRDRVLSFRDTDAERQFVLRAAEEAGAQTGPDSTVWIYFAGHGGVDHSVQDGTENRVLMLFGARRDLQLTEQYSVKPSELTALAGANGARVMLVLDTCYTGAGRDGESISPEVARGSFGEGARAVSRTAGEVVEWSATRRGQVAQALPKSGHGAFTAGVLGALRGWADGYDGSVPDGRVTGREASVFVSEQLAGWVNGQDTQWATQGSSTSGTWVLTQGQRLESKPTSAELAVWSSAPGAVVVPDLIESVVDSGGERIAVDISSLEARIRERECQTVADARAVQSRDASLLRKKAWLESSLTSQWSSLKATSERCAAVDDVGLRGECRDAVAAFFGAVSSQTTVRATAGEHEVVTDCGMRRGLAPEAELVVSEDLREEVMAFLATYNDDGTLGAAASGGGVDAMSAVLGTLKWIPAGTFQMGSPSSESGRDDDETQHRVTLSSGYWMMEREVSQGMWQSVMGSNPSHFSSCGSTCPVEKVSWTEAVEFASRLSRQEGVTYRLPTEAEWEYGARGGEEYRYAGGSNLTSVGWVEDNSNSRTHPSCQKTRNGFGLCDMTGNVWEWTGDWYGAYPTGSVTDPTGLNSGSNRVFRGGSWRSSSGNARVANRYSHTPGSRPYALGFRLVRTNP